MDEDGEPLADGWPEGFGPEQSGGMRQGYSVIEALNWYAYVSNNPVKYVDPTGKVDVYYGYSWTSANRVGGQYVTQNTARDADMYQQGGGGPYSLNVGPYTTWCNQATFDIAEKTGFDTTDMYGGKDRGFVTANDAARNLSLTQASTYSELLEVSGGQAQALADKGYTVIAAWENKNGGSGHIATVRAYEEYTDEDGPTVSNVGQWNSILSVRDAFAVKEGGASSMDDIKYYYDPNQKFED